MKISKYHTFNLIDGLNILLFRIIATTIEDLSDNYKKGTNENGDCFRLLVPESEGIMVLNLVNDVKQGYAVTVGVTVTNSVHQSPNNFTQLIMGTTTTAPDISLM